MRPHPSGFLAVVTQAPLTAFFIVMERVNGHALALSLAARALVASGVSHLISAPLHAALALERSRLAAAPSLLKKSEPQGGSKRESLISPLNQTSSQER